MFIQVPGRACQDSLGVDQEALSADASETR
jgi:hypothetical protein